MSLSDLDIKLEYRSDADDLVNDFYVPNLEKSVRYTRAVGYFTSAGLSAAARGIAKLIKNNGHMTLIASPRFLTKDIQEMRLGYKMKEEVLEQALTRELESISDDIIRERVQSLAWLISVGRLDIKIAVRVSPTGSPVAGIFHEKTGVFEDSEGNKVAFSGSPNETASGLVENFEDINVFTSWRDKERVKKKCRHLENLCNNTVSGLEVMDFPEASKEKILSYRPDEPPDFDPKETRPFLTKRKIKLRDYQKDAIEAWKKAGHKGILSMATGTGKTIVALEAIREFIKENRMPIVLVPSRALLDQWRDEIQESYPDARVVLCYGGFRDWKDKLERMIVYGPSSDNKAEGKPRFILATMASGSRSHFLNTILKFGSSEKFVLIVDEVHRIGAASYRRALRIASDVRLGLSATPSRAWDILGTEAIMDYFGSVVYEYDIKRAIKEGYLSPYEYLAHPVTMTYKELEEYNELSKAFAKLMGKVISKRPELRGIPLPRLISMLGNMDEEDDKILSQITVLLNSRRRIVKKAKNKLNVIVKIAAEERLSKCLIYCEDYDQIDDIQRELGETDIGCTEYTARLDSEERGLALNALKNGHVDYLLSCRCLDEGVDIPACESAILVASSKSTREFIQRRGRLLRLHPGKKYSKIHDLFVVPTDQMDKIGPIEDFQRGILQAEISRAKLFAEDALNKKNAEDSVKLIEDAFGLDNEKVTTEIVRN